MNIVLPTKEGNVERYAMVSSLSPVVTATAQPFNRIAYAAAHVVVDPLKETNPWDETAPIDWERTLAFREYLWGLGFKVAEAMDTAQRGMGLGWTDAAELIRRSAAHARTFPGADLACGVGTDQLEITDTTTLDDVLAAYREQFDVVESAGSRGILMASRALCTVARSEDDYLQVYGKLLSEAKDKVVLHWLGEMFDPLLKGYWGSADIPTAMNTVLRIIEANQDKVEGIKVSLLDAKWEIDLRNRLPKGVSMYTGDDFNYGELIAGDEHRYSHALLGIFDPIAPVAANALTALAQGDLQKYHALMTPTVALSREVFKAPTRHYKAGVIFLAWLNGHQDHISMLGGLQSARCVMHYVNIFRLADQCGVLIRPELALQRMRRFLTVAAGLGG